MQRELVNTVPNTLQSYANPANSMMQNNYYPNQMYPPANNSNSYGTNGMDQKNQIQNGETNMNNLPQQTWSMNQNQYIPNTNLSNQSYGAQLDSNNAVNAHNIPGVNQYQMNYNQAFNQPSQPYNPMISYGPTVVQRPLGPTAANPINYSAYVPNSIQTQSLPQTGQVENQTNDSTRPQETVSDVQLISFD